MEENKKTPIPNPAGPTVKVGDKVKITEGEWANYVGEVVEFYNRGKNWVKLVKVVKDDGKVEFVEVTNITIQAIHIIEQFTKTSIFKKIAEWFKKVFRKKKKKKDKEDK